ncbi:MAG: glycosyltransferase 87 family protein [Anaerolineae bacterium]
MTRTYALRILVIFLVLFFVYLLIAHFVLEPMGYYGTAEEPRFADPWIARAETIVSGGLLYRDVFTTTPPLINLLLVPPALVSGLFGHVNPWATLSFMTYFSLFNLFTAYALLFTTRDREEGYRAALYFLFNPLTFGNSLLRRQDEPILAFFFSLALLFLLHRRHWKASAVIGLTLLVKLSGALMIPIAFLRTRDWRYLIIPPIIFGLVFAPFLLAAGKSAIFWDVSKERTQHPFQFRGVSLGALWAQAHEGQPPVSLAVYSAILVMGSAIVLALIVWKPLGLLEDLTLLTTTGLLLSPKLHCGYFSLLVLTMAPLLRKYRIGVFYFLFGLLALVADMCKWPVRNYPVAFWLMVAVFVILATTMVWMRWQRGAQEGIVGK